MCNESKGLLPGTLPPCSRTLACSLGSEHTRDGCTAHTTVPYNHNRCHLKALGARLRAHDNLQFCSTVFCSSGNVNSLLGENKDV